jgi:hypothetical protein
MLVAAIAVILSAPSLAQAGVYTDDMSKCLVDSSSKEDRIALVRWIFVAMSQHSAVKSLTNAKGSDIEKANADAGALYMKLLTVSCADATSKALKYEGPAALQLSFQVLGQVAARDMFSDLSVVAAMSGLEKYTDKEKLEALGK